MAYFVAAPSNHGNVPLIARAFRSMRLRRVAAFNPPNKADMTVVDTAEQILANASLETYVPLKAFHLAA